jgi:malonate transporter
VLGVATGFAVIGVAIIVGYVLARTGVLGDGAYLALNRMSFYAATPALLFTILSRSDLRVVVSPHMAIAVMSFFAAAAVSLLVSRLVLRSSFGESVVGMVSSGFSNNNNIGLPLTLYIVGDVHYAAIVMLMQSVLVTPPFLAALSKASGERSRIGDILLGVVTNPIIIAAALGLTVAAIGVELPAPVMAPIEMIATAAIPVILIAFGVSLVGQGGLRPMAAGAGAVISASAIKLVFMPVVAFLLAHFVFGLKGVPLLAAVLIAALPTGQMVFSYAARYGVGVPLARNVVLVTTLGCVPIVVLIALLLG